jgi:hypothetical protein
MVLRQTAYWIIINLVLRVEVNTLDESQATQTLINVSPVRVYKPGFVRVRAALLLLSLCWIIGTLVD